MLLRLALQLGKFFDGLGQLRLADEMPVGQAPQFVALQSVQGVQGLLHRLNCLRVSSSLRSIERASGQVEGVLQNAAVV